MWWRIHTPYVDLGDCLAKERATKENKLKAFLKVTMIESLPSMPLRPFIFWFKLFSLGFHYAFHICTLCYILTTSTCPCSQDLIRRHWQRILRTRKRISALGRQFDVGADSDVDTMAVDRNVDMNSFASQFLLEATDNKVNCFWRRSLESKRTLQGCLN